MSVGMVFYVIALVLFLLAWVGGAVIPNPLAGGLFCLTLGLILSGVSFPRG
jgi:hypothetical protein